MEQFDPDDKRQECYFFFSRQCLKESRERALQKTHSHPLIILDRFVRSTFVSPATHAKSKLLPLNQDLLTRQVLSGSQGLKG